MTLQLLLLMALVIFGATLAGQLMRGRRVRLGLALIPPVLFLGAAFLLMKVVLPGMQKAGMQAVESRIK
jgi:hypothetical protein